MDRSTLEVVEKILQNAQTDCNFKSTQVTKDIDVDVDVGNLLAVDSNPLDLKRFRSERDKYLLEFARDDVQLLVNELWKLPVEVSDNTHVVKLPAPTTVIPREKPIPAAKKPTRWEEYARVKGINKRKRGRKVWDEESKEWRPRWGYKRANDSTKDWCVEVPEQADPFEDQFEKRLKAKKEAVAKNELQRLRNIARNMKGKVPGVGLTPVDKPDRDHMSRALSVARTSTASLGKFDETLPQEKPEKRRGKKRKFEPNHSDLHGEKKRSLDILHKLQSHQPLLDADKTANRLVAAEQQKRAEKKKSNVGNSDNRKSGSQKKHGKGSKGKGKTPKRSSAGKRSQKGRGGKRTR